jgi:hypothetical protein
MYEVGLYRDDARDYMRPIRRRIFASARRSSMERRHLTPIHPRRDTVPQTTYGADERPLCGTKVVCAYQKDGEIVALIGRSTPTSVEDGVRFAAVDIADALLPISSCLAVLECLRTHILMRAASALWG